MRHGTPVSLHFCSFQLLLLLFLVGVGDGSMLISIVRFLELDY